MNPPKKTSEPQSAVGYRSILPKGGHAIEAPRQLLKHQRTKDAFERKSFGYKPSKIMQENASRLTLEAYKELNEISLYPSIPAMHRPPTLSEHDELHHPLPYRMRISYTTPDGSHVRAIYLIPETTSPLDARQRSFLTRSLEAIKCAGAASSTGALHMGTGEVSTQVAVSDEDQQLLFGGATEVASLILHYDALSMTKLQVQTRGYTVFEASFAQQQDSDLAIISAFRTSHIDRNPAAAKYKAAALEDYMVWSGIRRKNGVYCSSLRVLVESKDSLQYNDHLIAFKKDLKTYEKNCSGLFRQRTPAIISKAIEEYRNLKTKSVAKVLPRDAELLQRILRESGEGRDTLFASLYPHFSALHALASSLKILPAGSGMPQSLEELSHIAADDFTAASVVNIREKVDYPLIKEKEFRSAMTTLKEIYTPAGLMQPPSR